MVRGTPAAAEDTVVERLPVAGDLLHQPALAYWCGAMLPQLNDIHTPQPQPPDQDLVAFAPCPLQPRLLPPPSAVWSSFARPALPQRLGARGAERNTAVAFIEKWGGAVAHPARRPAGDWTTMIGYMLYFTA